MIRFDRIKFKAHINCVETFDCKAFKPREENGKLLYGYFHSTECEKHKYPFDLQVKINFLTDEVVVDLPAKILMSMYFERINFMNISYCISKLWSEHGLVKLNVPLAIQTGEVLSCDVARDIPNLRLSNKDYKLLSSNSHLHKWQPKTYSNGITFTSQMVTRKVSLALYNKMEELMLARNTVFLQEAELEGLLMNSDILRVEGKYQRLSDIRKAFQTETTGLREVLHSHANPLWRTITEIVDVQSLAGKPNALLDSMRIGDYKNFLLVKESGFDERKLRVIIERFYGQKTNKRALMRRYRPYLNANGQTETSTLLELIKFLESHD